MNELLLVISLLFAFGFSLAFFYFFGKGGCFAWISLCTIFANIEVVILVNAFGIEQTLGNTLFAASFLSTDFLSEFYSKKDANTAVKIGLASSVSFILLSFLWMFYIPSENDWAFESVKTLFAHTPRILIASFLAYAISEFLDVKLYHALWDYTHRKTENKDSFLWLRNNVATLASQAVNALAFNLCAFWGIYDAKTLFSITFASYVIYIVTSILDTPFLYAARKLHRLKEKGT